MKNIFNIGSSKKNTQKCVSNNFEAVDFIISMSWTTSMEPNPFSYFSQYAYNGISRFLGWKKKDKDFLVRLNFIENMDKRDE